MAGPKPSKGARERLSYREMLLEEIGSEKYKEVAKGFDLLGNIAIIDAEPGVAKKMARIIIDTHKSVETVLRKGGAVKGKYRKRRYEFVAGKRNYIAEYNENGASFTFDVRKTFFSPRLAYERKRVADLSRDGEKVVVMFAGVGPFAIEIAKKDRKGEVVAIELNSYAYRCMIANAKMNKTGNVAPVLGDAGRPPARYKNFADRIIMPLPMDSRRFLTSAFEMAGRKCVVHYYAFVGDGGRGEIAKLREFSRRRRRKFTLLGKRVVRPYSARISEVVVDFRISR